MATGSKQDYRNDSDVDDRLNPAEILEREKIAGYDRNNDGLDDHPVIAGDASGKSGELSGGAKNIDDVKDREEANPMNSSFTGKGSGKSPISLKTRLMKKGPLGGIVLLLAAGGFGITGLLSPSLLIVQLTDMFTNNFNDANTALHVRTNVMLAKKINNTKNSFAESKDGKCNIRCKMGTMSDGMKRNLEAKGYDVKTKGDSKFGRWIVSEITLPDGSTVKNGAEFKTAMKDPVKFAQFSRVYSSKTAYFLNTKFGNTLKTKLGLTKAFKLAGESKTKFNESFRKALNLPDKTAVDTPNPNATPEEKLKNSRFSKLSTSLGTVPVKAAGLANVAGIACLAYDTTRAISAAVKFAKYTAYAAVALTFFNAASKLKAGDAGGIDPNVMTELGNRLTATNVNTTDGSAGLSASDSYGWKAAQYGDNGAMPEYAKAHSMESAGLLGAMSSLMKFFTGQALARTVAHSICGIANGPLGVAIACVPAAETGPGVLGCIGIQILIAAGLSIVIANTMPIILEWLINANVNMPDENTAGAQLGDILYPGGAAILGAQASSYGMAPGNKEQISSYVAAGEEIRKQNETIARMEAKSQPFDIYNQYSFLGSMVRNMNVAAYSNASLTRTSNLLFASLPRSLASLVTSAHAGTYMPLNDSKADQYGKVQCPEVDFTGETNSDCCPSLALIGAVGDGYCMPAFVKSADEMNSDPDETLDFMIEGEYIDEDTGEPRTDTDHGKQFQKYLDYCPFRTEGWGETAKSLAEGNLADYEWYIGAMCNKDTDDTALTATKSITELIRLNPVISLPTGWINDLAEDGLVENDIKHFRNYTMDEPVNATLAGEDSVLKHSPLPAGSDTPAPEGPTENSGNVNPDGWTFPTTAGAPLVSPFGPRGGGFHTGVDLGVPSGSPFYATRDGVVLTREFNIYSIAGGSWCPVVPSESPIQKDIWITHNVDGVTYTSIYAHMSKFLVSNGATVKAGDLIGYTGGSGCSSGPHVHFEIWQSGSPNPGVPSSAALDPWPLINP